MNLSLRCDVVRLQGVQGIELLYRRDEGLELVLEHICRELVALVWHVRVFTFSAESTLRCLSPGFAVQADPFTVHLADQYSTATVGGVVTSSVRGRQPHACTR